MTPYTVASFFAGIGCNDVAFTWAGYTITAQVEISRYCQKVLKKHAPTYWPNARVFNDIRTTTAAEIGSVDVIVGGFPCQDISQAGKEKGITNGTRSGLWFEFSRLIGEIRPRLAMLENVPRINTVGGIAVVTSLTEIGYGARWLPVFASDVGSPQPRERWLAVAYPDDSRQAPAEITGQNAQAILNIPQGAQHTRQSERSGSPATIPGSIMAFTEHPDVGTLRSDLSAKSIMGRAFDGIPDRVDGYRWVAGLGEPQHPWEPPRTVKHGTTPHWEERIEALGNAVVPQMIYPFAVAMREYLESVDAHIDSL